MSEEEENDEKVFPIEDIKTSDDLEQAIEDRAGIGLRDGSVPVLRKYCWFDKIVFELFQQIPITKEPLASFVMFQDAEEVRIYAILKPKQGQQPPEGVPPYQRITLAKQVPNMGFEAFPGSEEEPTRGLATFVDLIVRELQELAEIPEGEEAIARLEAAREALAANRIDEAIRILEDEDDDKPPKPNGQQPATGA